MNEPRPLTPSSPPPVSAAEPRRGAAAGPFRGFEAEVLLDDLFLPVPSGPPAERLRREPVVAVFKVR